MKFDRYTKDEITKAAKRDGIKPRAAGRMIRDVEAVATMTHPAIADADGEARRGWVEGRDAWAALLERHAKGTEKLLREARKLPCVHAGEVEALALLARHHREATEALATVARKPRRGRPPRWAGRDVFCKRMVRAWESAGGESVIAHKSPFIVAVDLVLRDMYHGRRDRPENPASLFKDGKGQPRFKEK